MGADGREEFWSRFADLSTSSGYQTALQDLSSVQLYDLIQRIGNAPEWADLKTVLETMFKNATDFPPPTTNAVEAYLEQVMTSADDAKKALDAGLIDPQKYLQTVQPLIDQLDALARNLDRIGQTDAAASVRQLGSALSATTAGITDPAKLEAATHVRPRHSR